MPRNQRKVFYRGLKCKDMPPPEMPRGHYVRADMEYSAFGILGEQQKLGWQDKEEFENKHLTLEELSKQRVQQEIP